MGWLLEPRSAGAALSRAARVLRAVALAAAALVVLPSAVGCQTAQTAPLRLINHRAMIDFSGLKPLETYDPVKAQAAVPLTWERLKLKRTALFTDLQWRSPSRGTAVGVAHVRMPLPLTSRMLLWFARSEYSKKADDGKVLGEWVDGLGRQWFEAENNQFHVRGFILTRGFDAWIMYSGYKTTEPLDGSELALAQRAMETIVPVTKGSEAVAPADGASAAPASREPTSATVAVPKS